MPPRSGGYAQKTMLVGIRVSDDEDPKGIIHNSSFIIHNSQFTIHNSPFIIHNSQFTIHHSQFTIH